MCTLLVDDYDSYTFNLFQLRGEVNGTNPVMIVNDDPVAGDAATWDIRQHRDLSRAGRPQNSRDVGYVIEPGVVKVDNVEGILGQLVDGVLISANLFGTTWRPVFGVNVPIGLITIALAAKLVPKSRAHTARGLDLPGVAVLAVALFLLVVPISEGRQAGWLLWTWLSLAASGVTFAIWTTVERPVETRG